MTCGELIGRCRHRVQREAARRLAKRPFRMRNTHPLISFTFDDFPRSALHTAGVILEDRGFSATYYVSLGLMGTRAPTGEMFTRSDLTDVLEKGHELGCHTLAHCHAGYTSPAVFERSILENREMLADWIPGAPRFQTLSYPIGLPRPATKKCCARNFAASRGGGQTYNARQLDLDLLSAFFIEQSRDNPAAIRATIDANAAANGWLIFATHDVAREPTPYGCTPEFFAEVVSYAAASGAQILSVENGLEAIGVIAGKAT